MNAELRDFLAQNLLEELAFLVELLLSFGEQVPLLLFRCVTEHFDEGDLLDCFDITVLLRKDISLPKGKRGNFLSFSDALVVKLLVDEEFALMLEFYILKLNF